MADKNVRRQFSEDLVPRIAFESPQLGDNSNFAGRIIKSSLGAASSVNR
jgi:hypothetical protein